MNNILKKVLPWIGAAATGGVPGLIAQAAKTVAEATGAKVDSNADSIAAAVAGATPEQLQALKKLDQDFAVRMKELGFQNEQELAQIEAGDRANARAREIALKDRLPAVLAIAVTVGFFGCLALMMFKELPGAGHDVLMVMIGSLGTAWSGIISYYFGSSAGSAAKTEILAKSGKDS